jgi:hypothetical protein
MAKIAENPIVKSIGNFVSGDNLGGKIARGAIAILSTPAEVMGSIAKNIIDTSVKVTSQVKDGNIFGAAGTLVTSALTNVPKAVFEGTTNAFSGVLDPSKMQPSMFEKAAQSAIDNNLFGAKTNPEMAALARIIGGTLNVAGDPLTYLGIGAATKIPKITSAAASKAPRSPRPNLFDDEYRIANIKEELVKALKNPAVVTRRSVASVEAMLRDNKPKTLFDTGTSAAAADKGLRSQYEAANFGPENVGNMIYGYLANRQTLTARIPFFPRKDTVDSFRPFSYATSQYGDTLIELRKSFLERVSLTAGDSLENFYGMNPLKSGVRDAGFITRDLKNAKQKDLRNFAETYRAGNDAYIEAQFSKFDPRLDIKTIWMSANDARTAQLRDTVKELGLNIPVKVATFGQSGSVLGNALSKAKGIGYEVSHRLDQFRKNNFDLSRYNPFTNKYGDDLEVETLANGGMVSSRFAAGGMAKGTDTVPAMLTPGEFVVKRPMVNKYGTDLLDRINSGSLSSVQRMSSPSFSSGSPSVSVSQSSVPSRQAAASSSNSVYNYSLSVNVASQADPNTIAQTVMAQLQRVDSQRVRNGRF